MEHVRLVHFRGDVEAERPHMMSEYLRMKSQSHNFLIQSNEINGLWQLPVSLHHLYGLHSPDLPGQLPLHNLPQTSRCTLSDLGNLHD